jgi:adenylate cyclase
LADPALYLGAESGPERAARSQLLQYCHARGASIERMRKAAHDGTIATLPLELALRGERRYTLSAIARASGISLPYLRSVLIAIGYPNPRPRERAFSEEDLRAAQALGLFLRAGLPRQELLEVLRVGGRAIAQIAAVVRRFVGDALIQPGDTEHDLGLRYVSAVEQLLPELTPLLSWQLKMHLREQATREVIGRAEREAGALRDTREVAVCFADLSGFSRLGTRLPAEQMGTIATRMAMHCYDVAQQPVELVKTIGDGAMFVSPDVPALIEAICALTERVESDGSEMPTLRAGLAFGPAVFRLGDWFGATVNRASRIAELARPRAILVDAAAREQAGEHFRWRRTRPRSLRGIERWATLYQLVRTYSS